MLVDILPKYNILYDTGKLNSNAIRIISSNNELLELLMNETSFLSPNVTLRERLYCIVHKITSPVLCKMCNTPLTIKKSGRLEYPIYCSRKCTKSDTKHIQSKISQTCLDKYGHKSVLSVPEIREKQEQTKLKKYGVDNVFKLASVQQKIKENNIEKYGVDNPSKNLDILRKRKQTNLDRYGNACPLQNKNIKRKSAETMMVKYGVEHSSNIPDHNDKIKKTHLKNCGKFHSSQKHLNNQVILKLQNKKWLYEQHIIQQKSLLRISKELGCGDTMVGRYLHSHEIDTKIHYSSEGEIELFEYISLLYLKKIQCNIRSIIHPYELDIYIPEHKLAIEYCGLYWHSEQQGKDRQYHKRKYELCKEQGIQLLTIFEDEWQQRQEQVKNKILSLLNKNKQEKIFARKTNIIKVSTKQKQDFFNANHIQGNGPGSINLGLEYEGTLVACMSFIKQKEQHYLNRYATSCNIPGGFSKLLKYFQTNYEWQYLISFADLRWSNGNLYEKTGWKLDSILSPDYYYSQDGRNRYHKFGYRRQFLPRLLKEFNPELSERENCDNNGILRIWDCGKLRYVLTNTGE